MSPRQLLPALAALVIALCAACDEPADTGAQAPPKGKNGHHSHSSKKDRDPDEPPKGEFKIGRLDRKLIPESSGVIDSRKHPGVFWTFNDSGNGPEIFAINREGRLLDQYTLNVHNTDWEAITADGEGHLYIGDIGNNEHRRDRVMVYRIDEPDPTAAGAKAPATGTVRVGPVWRLDFPGQPFDAESLFLYKGKGYIISKLLTAKPAGLYSFDLDSKEDAQTLQHVCDLPIRTPVTDAAITPDGARLAVMTVTGPYLFQIDGDVASAGMAQPKRQVYFDLKDLNMEGVCFVEGGLLATTEHGQVLFFRDADFK